MATGEEDDAEVLPLAGTRSSSSASARTGRPTPAPGSGRRPAIAARPGARDRGAAIRGSQCGSGRRHGAEGRGSSPTPCGGRAMGRHGPASGGPAARPGADRLSPDGHKPAPGPRQLPSCTGSSRLSSGSTYPGMTTGTSTSATGAPITGPLDSSNTEWTSIAAVAGSPMTGASRTAGVAAERGRVRTVQAGRSTARLARSSPARRHRHRGRQQATSRPGGTSARRRRRRRRRPVAGEAALGRHSSPARGHPRTPDPWRLNLRDRDQHGHRDGRRSSGSRAGHRWVGVDLSHGGHPAFLAVLGRVADSRVVLRRAGSRRHDAWQLSRVGCFIVRQRPSNLNSLDENAGAGILPDRSG